MTLVPRKLDVAGDAEAYALEHEGEPHEWSVYRETFEAVAKIEEEPLDTEPIHSWFGLTYASYLVLPRSVLQSMPPEWQRQMVKLLDEMTDSFGHLDWPSYHVQALARPRQVIYREECPECEGSGAVGPDLCESCDGAGEVECNRYETEEEVGFMPDPIPGYNRGRTKLEPRREP